LQTNSKTYLYNLQNNPRFFIESLLYIKTKKSKLVPLKLNEEQLVLDKVLARERAKNKPVRILLLKCRQFGGSTWTEANIFQNTSTHPNVDSLIISHDNASTTHILRMSRLFYDKLDKNKYKPMTSATNRNEIVFENPNKKDRQTNPGLRSSIRVETAGNPNAGVSRTIQNLHISEISKWENAEEVMTGLMQTVPDEPNTLIVIESTANGIGGKGEYFYELWKDAKSGNNDFVPVFIPWWSVNEYSKSAPDSFVLFDYEHPNYGNEVQIKDRYNLTIDQMYWRRYKIKNYCKNSLKKFQQEFFSLYYNQILLPFSTPAQNLTCHVLFLLKNKFFPCILCLGEK